jgi:protein-S-isoprenylcysteine O-methyltransferase Ste14
LSPLCLFPTRRNKNIDFYLHVCENSCINSEWYEDETNKIKACLGFGSSAALLVCYVVSRHDVLGLWHNMHDWPAVLLVLGLAAIGISAFVFAQKVMLCVPCGYIAGFVLAAVFNAEGVDPGGGTTNNGWIVWAATLLVFIAAGVIWELAHRRGAKSCEEKTAKSKTMRKS